MLAKLLGMLHISLVNLPMTLFGFKISGFGKGTA